MLAGLVLFRTETDHRFEAGPKSGPLTGKGSTSDRWTTRHSRHLAGLSPPAKRRCIPVPSFEIAQIEEDCPILSSASNRKCCPSGDHTGFSTKLGLGIVATFPSFEPSALAIWNSLPLQYASILPSGDMAASVA